MSNYTPIQLEVVRNLATGGCTYVFPWLGEPRTLIQHFGGSSDAWATAGIGVWDRNNLPGKDMSALVDGGVLVVRRVVGSSRPVRYTLADTLPPELEIIRVQLQLGELGE